MPRSRRLALSCSALIAVAATALVGCGGSETPDDPAVTIGSKGFTESQVVAAAYAQALRHVGFTPTVRVLDGSPAMPPALRSGAIDLYPEYTGTAWTIVEGESPLKLAGKPGTQQQRMVAGRLAADSAVHAFPPAPGSNNAVAVCTKASGITSIAQFAGRPTPVSIAGAPEVFTRPDALPLLEKAYGFTTGRKVPTQPADRYGPIARGQVECMAAYETDPQIKSLGLVIATDPRGILGGAIDYRPMALASAAWWQGLSGEMQAKVDEALVNVSRKMTTAWLREANRRVTDDGERPDDVALELVNISVPDRAAAPR